MGWFGWLSFQVPRKVKPTITNRTCVCTCTKYSSYFAAILKKTTQLCHTFSAISNISLILSNSCLVVAKSFSITLDELVLLLFVYNIYTNMWTEFFFYPAVYSWQLHLLSSTNNLWGISSWSNILDVCQHNINQIKRLSQ